MYKTIYTTTGLALVSKAVSQQRTIELTHFAVGDGGGNSIEPIESMTQLVRERYRATINRIYQDPENENKYTAATITLCPTRAPSEYKSSFGYLLAILSRRLSTSLITFLAIETTSSSVDLPSMNYHFTVLKAPTIYTR